MIWLLVLALGLLMIWLVGRMPDQKTLSTTEANKDVDDCVDKQVERATPGAGRSWETQTSDAAQSSTAEAERRDIEKKVSARRARANELDLPAIVHDAYEHLQTWFAGSWPGMTVPAGVTNLKHERIGRLEKYSFVLGTKTYSVACGSESLLVADGEESEHLDEIVSLIDQDAGRVLYSQKSVRLWDEPNGYTRQLGDIFAFVEGEWIADIKKFNSSFDVERKRWAEASKEQEAKREKERLEELKRNFDL